MHTVESNIPCTAYDCGVAVPKFAVGFVATVSAAQATAQNAFCRCTVQSSTGTGFLINAAPNTSLYARNTVIPAVRYDIPAGTTTLRTTVTSHCKPAAGR